VVTTGAPSSADAGAIVVQDVAKTFVDQQGRAHKVLEDINFSVEPGRFICLLGRSGCGKTTLLNLLAGFEESDAGDIRVGNRAVDGPGPDRTLMFQDYALFPWLSAIQNVEFVLKAKASRVRSRSERTQKAREVLDLVGLRGKETRPVYQLSGGMRQRVALARALVVRPKVLLMDEPFGALDAQQRMDMQEELVRIWAATGQTIVFVTHSLDEATFLADTVFVMVSDPGQIRHIEQVEIQRPRDRTGAKFNEVKRSLASILEIDAKRRREDDEAVPDNAEPTHLRGLFHRRSA